MAVIPKGGMTATTTLELSSRQHLARTRESSGVCALSERSDSVQSRHDDSLGVTSESNGQTRDCNRLGQDGGNSFRGCVRQVITRPDSAVGAGERCLYVPNRGMYCRLHRRRNGYIHPEPEIHSPDTSSSLPLRWGFSRVHRTCALMT